MFPKGLIVSSQALEGNPMKSTEKLASMAEAAAKGGASALRVDGADMVKELKKRTDVPIIAINKIKDKIHLRLRRKKSGLYRLEPETYRLPVRDVVARPVRAVELRELRKSGMVRKDGCRHRATLYAHRRKYRDRRHQRTAPKARKVVDDGGFALSSATIFR